MFSCFYTKFLSNKNTAVNLKESSDLLDFKNNYPIVDNLYHKGWEAAENSGEDIDINKYYFCGNLTLAIEIEQDIFNKVLELRDHITNKHRPHLVEASQNIFNINNDNSKYEIDDTDGYERLLKYIKIKYDRIYIKTLEKIEENLNDHETQNELTVKCENHKEIPEKKSPSHHNVQFIEFGAKKVLSLKMSVKEREILNSMISLLEKTRNIIKKYSA